MSLERVKQNESYFVAKAATRVVVAGLSLVALGLYAASGASKEMQATDYTGFIWGQIGVLVLPILWTGIYLLCCVKLDKPLHPGWPVAFDLILWMALVAMGVMCLLFAAIESTDAGDYDYYSSCCIDDPSDHCDPVCKARWTSNLHKAGILGLVGGSFTIVVGILEFSLFVRACIECDRYNKQKSDKRVEKLAKEIVRDLIARGELVRPRAAAPSAPIASNPEGGFELKNIPAPSYRERADSAEMPREEFEVVSPLSQDGDIRNSFQALDANQSYSARETGIP